MEATLNDVVSLFKYLTDKDVFMMVYSKLLSKRLIGDLSASEDAESSMIQKLKVLYYLYFIFPLLPSQVSFLFLNTNEMARLHKDLSTV